MKRVRSHSYAKGGVLVLDKAIVARETLFYAIALVLLLYVLMREHDGDNHIVIRWWAGPVLVAVYALYVVVAATYSAVSYTHLTLPTKA